MDADIVSRTWDRPSCHRAAGLDTEAIRLISISGSEDVSNELYFDLPDLRHDS